jgi:hypothetical protein
MIIFTSSNCSRHAMARLYPKVVAFFFLIHEIMLYSQFTSIGKVKEALFILTGGSVSPSSPNPFSHPPRSPLPPSFPPTRGGRTEDASLLLHGGGQRMLRFCCMGEGEPEASKAHLYIAPLSPGGRGAGGEGAEFKLTQIRTHIP